MRGLKRTYVFLAIAFPALAVGVPGIVFGMIRDPDEWVPLAVSAVFAALPFVAVLIFMKRRAGVLGDPVKVAGVRFATKMVLWYNVALWLMPIFSKVVLGKSGVNFSWIFLLAAQPIYVYPLLLLAERVGRRLAMRNQDTCAF